MALILFDDLESYVEWLKKKEGNMALANKAPFHDLKCTRN